MTWQTNSINQQPGSGTNYPFVKPPTSVRYLLGDLYLAFTDDRCVFVPPFRVAFMYGFGTGATGRRDMVITDANGHTVFDTNPILTAELTDVAWGDNLRVLTWADETTTLRATMRIAPPQWSPATTWSNAIDLGTAGVLHARCVDRIPARVTSIRVGMTRISAADLVLSEGYNCELSRADNPSVDGGRRVRRVGIRFRPGDGLGRLPGCDDVEPVLRRINTVAPTDGGDFVIDTQDCYWLRRPAVITTASPRTATLGGANFEALLADALDDVPAAFFADDEAKDRILNSTDDVALATLQILNDCGPCCTCDDFVNTHEGIRRLYNRYKAIGEQADDARDLYELNRARWEAQKACRTFQTLRLTLQAERNWGLFVGGVHCNMTDCCTTPLLLRTTFETFLDGEPVAAEVSLDPRCTESKRAGTDTDYDERVYQPIFVSSGVLDHIFDFADPSATSKFRNRLRVMNAAADTVRVTLSVHAPASVDKDTGVACTLPDPDGVDVPASVLAIWADVGQPAYPIRGLIQKTVPVSATAGCGVCP